MTPPFCFTSNNINNHYQYQSITHSSTKFWLKLALRSLPDCKSLRGITIRQSTLPPLANRADLQPTKQRTRTSTMTSNLPAVSAATQTLDNYAFPRHRLRLSQNDPSRTPLVLIACGSFSPVTFLHLRMFEMVWPYPQTHKKLY